MNPSKPVPRFQRFKPCLMPFSTATLPPAMSATLDQAGNDGMAPVCIAVVDMHGHLLLLQRNPAAAVRSIRIAEAKAYTAVRMGMSTARFQRRLQDERLSAQDFMDPGFTSLPGGLPIQGKDGKILGGVGVSGRSPDQDEALAQAFIDRLALN